MAGGACRRVLPDLVKTLRREAPKISNQTLPSLRSRSQSSLHLSQVFLLIFYVIRRAFSLYDQINLIDSVPEDQLRFQGYFDFGFLNLWVSDAFVDFSVLLMRVCVCARARFFSLKYLSVLVT